MSPLIAKRTIAVALPAVVVLLLLAIGAIAYQSITSHGPTQRKIVSLDKQEDWQAFGGTWQYADDVMSNISDERGAKLMTGPEHWANYSVEADVLLLGQYGDAGLIIRASDEEHGGRCLPRRHGRIARPR